MPIRFSWRRFWTHDGAKIVSWRWNAFHDAEIISWRRTAFHDAGKIISWRRKWFHDAEKVDFADEKILGQLEASFLIFLTFGSIKQSNTNKQKVFVLKAGQSWVKLNIHEWKRLRGFTARVLFTLSLFKPGLKCEPQSPEYRWNPRIQASKLTPPQIEEATEIKCVSTAQSLSVYHFT